MSALRVEQNRNIDIVYHLIMISRPVCSSAYNDQDNLLRSENSYKDRSLISCPRSRMKYVLTFSGPTGLGSH